MVSFLVGQTISRVLNVLDALDRHNFDKVELSGNMESLYNKVFGPSQNKDNADVSRMNRVGHDQNGCHSADNFFN